MLTINDCFTGNITRLRHSMLRQRVIVSLLAFGLCLLEVETLQAQPATAISSSTARAIDELRVNERVTALPPTDAIKSQLKLSTTQLAGRNIRVKQDTGTIKVTAANIDEAVKPNALFIERTGSKVQLAAIGDKKTWQLPVQFNYIRSDGSIFSFTPFIEVMQPLLFNHVEGTFQGVLGLGVIDESRPGAREQLADPVSFTLTGVPTITPQQITVEHLSQPFQPIQLRLRNPGEEVTVDVFATLENEANTVVIPAIRPQLKLRISPSKSIDGFGLSTAVVHISAEDGGIFDGQQIALESTMGRLKDNSVTLDSAGTAQTRIRSSFIGPAVVTAQAYPFTESSDQVQFAWPIVFSIVAAIGALLGAWVRSRRKNASFGAALILGLVGALLGSIGVNFLKLPVEIPAGEAFIFVVTFFTAYLGPKAFRGVVPAGAGAEE
jgi:hypothetical protein